MTEKDLTICKLILFCYTVLLLCAVYSQPEDSWLSSLPLYRSFKAIPALDPELDAGHPLLPPTSPAPLRRSAPSPDQRGLRPRPPRARQLSESSNNGHQLILSYSREVSPFTAGRYYPAWPFVVPFRDYSAFDGSSRRSIRRRSHF